MKTSKFLYIILVISFIIIPRCKNSSETTVTFKDSLNTVLGKITITSDMVLTVGEVSGGADVDPNNIVLYKIYKGEKKYVDHGVYGHIEVPYIKSREYITFVFPKYQGRSYCSGHRVNYAKKYQWHHKDQDGYSSDPEFIRSVMNTLDGLLIHGSLKEKGEGIGVGYGYCYGFIAGTRFDVEDGHPWVGVNPDIAQEDISDALLGAVANSLVYYQWSPNPFGYTDLDKEYMKLFLAYVYLVSPQNN